MKIFLNENFFEWKFFWMKIFLNENFFEWIFLNENFFEWKFFPMHETSIFFQVRKQETINIKT